MRFELIKGGSTTKVKPDYGSLYFIATKKALWKLSQDPNNKQLLKQTIFCGVKYINSSEYDKSDEEVIQTRFSFMSCIGAMIGQLTPSELMQVFPLDKTYDGDRYECKDYFYSIKALHEHGIDNPIGEGVIEFLWDYMNITTRNFTVKYMGMVDNVRRLEGKAGAIEELMSDCGATTYTMTKDHKGRTFMTDSKTGKTMRVRKKMPRYLQTVKKTATL